MSEQTTVVVEDVAAKEAAKLAKHEETLCEQYPHVILGSLAWIDSAQKFQCRIECEDCGDDQRLVFTSDLFQVKVCKDCAEKRKKARKAARRADEKAARELAKVKVSA